MNIKYFTKVLTNRKTYTYLSFESIVLIVFYTFYRVLNFNTAIFIAILVVLATALTSGSIYIIYYSLKELVKDDNQNHLEQCLKCARDASKYQFANFDFLTFEELLSIEASIRKDINPNDCYIYIYTSDLSTEDDAEKIVVNNIKSGVNYKVFYMDGTPTKRQIELYGENNLYKCHSSPIDRSADFDIMIFIDSKKHTTGYFCVNYSKPHGIRPCSEGYICTNKCHYENENLFYKKIRDDTVQSLLRVLTRYENFEK